MIFVKSNRGEGQNTRLSTMRRLIKTSLRTKLIHLLDCKTNEEYNRLYQKYVGLKDSKSTETTVHIANEHIFRIFSDLDKYAKSLFGLPATIWAEKMYNIIHYNFLKILILYLHNNSCAFYSLDTTLESKEAMTKISTDELTEEEELFVLEND